MSVHLDTLFFSVCIVGFTGTPVHIRHRRQIDPPEHRNSSVMPENTLKTHIRKQTLLFKAYKYSPPATPNILIPIQAAAAWPVPTWKQHTIRPVLSQITIRPSLMCRLTRTQVICEEVPPKNHWTNTQKPNVSYQADHVRLLGFISDGHQMSFLLVTPHKGHVKVHDICVIIVITDAVVLPPARVWSALRSWRKTTLINALILTLHVLFAIFSEFGKVIALSFLNFSAESLSTETVISLVTANALAPGSGDGGNGGIMGFFPLAIMQIQSWWASQFRSFHQDVPFSVVTISTQFSRPLWLLGSPWPQFVWLTGVPSLQW